MPDSIPKELLDRAECVIIFPSVKNERAVRAYEKAGFRWQSVWHDPQTGPAWFMVAKRDERR